MNIDPHLLRTLAGVLAMPGEDSLPALRELAKESAWLQPAIKELESIPLDAWQGEHTQLFITGFPKTPCPPFESAYRHGSMGGSATEELLGLYAKVNLTAGEMPADYLGTELEYAAYLLENDAEEALWPELWDGRLARWVPKFADDLIKHSQLELYRSVGGKLRELFTGNTNNEA